MTANSWINEVQAYAKLVNCHSNETTYLYLPETQIGRNPECSVITVRDINVSRLHCTFKKTTNNTCMFINQGLNGSYVNRKYCGPNDCVMLKDGDIIELVELQKYKFNYLADSNSITINSEPMDLSARSIYNLDSSDVFQYRDRSILSEIQKSSANLSQEETNKCTNGIKEISQLENDSEIIKNKRRKLKRKFEKTDTEQLLKELQELKNQLNESNTKCQELTNKFEEANLKLKEANLKLEILDSQRKLEKEEDYDIWSNLKCAVCLEFFIDVVMIEKCKHNFCKSCLENWKKQKKGCPICRSRINKYFPNPLIGNFVVDYINKKMDDTEREEREKTVKMRKIGNFINLEIYEVRLLMYVRTQTQQGNKLEKSIFMYLTIL
uniref:E3 ubiquitin-protein ligase CHFR n=1 Tax=Clastoptera arizonana TaxID=38151 RepID=A0A1B6DDE3_9HEMI